MERKKNEKEKKGEGEVGEGGDVETDRKMDGESFCQGRKEKSFSTPKSIIFIIAVDFFVSFYYTIYK